MLRDSKQTYLPPPWGCWGATSRVDTMRFSGLTRKNTIIRRWNVSVSRVSDTIWLVDAPTCFSFAPPVDFATSVTEAGKDDANVGAPVITRTSLLSPVSSCIWTRWWSSQSHSTPFMWCILHWSQQSSAGTSICNMNGQFFTHKYNDDCVILTWSWELVSTCSVDLWWSLVTQYTCEFGYTNHRLDHSNWSKVWYPSQRSHPLFNYFVGSVRPILWKTEIPWRSIVKKHNLKGLRVVLSFRHLYLFSWSRIKSTVATISSCDKPSTCQAPSYDSPVRRKPGINHWTVIYIVSKNRLFSLLGLLVEWFLTETPEFWTCFTYPVWVRSRLFWQWLAAYGSEESTCTRCKRPSVHTCDTIEKVAGESSERGGGGRQTDWSCAYVQHLLLPLFLLLNPAHEYPPTCLSHKCPAEHHSKKNLFEKLFLLHTRRLQRLPTGVMQWQKTAKASWQERKEK